MAVDTAVQTVALAGSVAATDMSIWGLIAQADLVVKFVMLLLMAASFVCWAIIFNKWTYFRNINYRMGMFNKAYRSSRSLNSLYDRVRKNKEDDPMADMFIAGIHQLQDSAPKKATADDLSVLKEKIYHSLHRTKNEAIDKMEKNLIFLATVGSASPFIGLFGTVWGIVNSFQAIAATKNTTLAVVAPGIAEALLATAMGLFAAIPAVIFYNMFSNNIRQVAGKLDDFTGELSTTLTYHKGKED